LAVIFLPLVLYAQVSSTPNKELNLNPVAAPVEAESSSQRLDESLRAMEEVHWVCQIGTRRYSVSDKRGESKCRQKGGLLKTATDQDAAAPGVESARLPSYPNILRGKINTSDLQILDKTPARPASQP
jgi:hypothetical protein